MKFVFTTLFFVLCMFLSQTHAQNNALNFDGSNDYVNCGNPAAFQIGTGTIEAWIKTGGAGSSYRGIVAKQFAYAMFLENNVLIFYDWSGGNSQSTGVNLADNQWHHVALSFQSGVTNGTKIYLDGNLSLTSTITVSNQTVPLHIGEANASQFFNGSIDGVRIWNVVRTQAEIQAAMNQELNSGTGLVAAYHFNQGVVGGNNSTVTTLNDALGNNNGTLNGFALTGSTSNWVDGTIDVVLPIELLNFEGRNTEGGNLLTWQTASETQNKGFDIERSTDVIYFEKIGFVLGNGTTIQKQDYFFKDESFEGVVYYRLKQLDFDGRFEYSKIISIGGKGKTVLSVFPNPSKGVFNVFGAENTDKEDFIFMNSVGQTVPIKVQNNRQIDFSVYPSGVYYLRVSSSGQVIRLVKE